VLFQGQKLTHEEFAHLVDLDRLQTFEREQLENNIDAVV